ncbi:MAG TPA: TonB-dependent receptor plug domain-containing protein, partial [Gemmatimonadales bacterium]|nr:TonB-dependent receptor plug domain-containing protein [Gemmatimonadales bacterium]
TAAAPSTTLTARRRSGAGRYLTAADIQRHRTFYISDMLGRVVGGIDVVRAADGSRTLTMRGVFEDRCTPALFVDGTEMKGFNADDLDGWVNPEKARGIEVYNAGFAPTEFVPSGMGTAAGCGVIVVWTR